MRLIDADELKKYIDRMADVFDDFALLDTDALPTIDPIRHGKWLPAEDGDGIVCSECGQDICTMIVDVYNYNYCPVCGAKMEKN